MTTRELQPPHSLSTVVSMKRVCFEGSMLWGYPGTYESISRVPTLVMPGILPEHQVHLPPEYYRCTYHPSITRAPARILPVYLPEYCPSTYSNITRVPTLALPGYLISRVPTRVLPGYRPGAPRQGCAAHFDRNISD